MSWVMSKKNMIGTKVFISQITTSVFETTGRDLDS
jgi:hypothetical protein